jgi:hypothetical protein
MVSVTISICSLMSTIYGSSLNSSFDSKLKSSKFLTCTFRILEAHLTGLSNLITFLLTPCLLIIVSTMSAIAPRGARISCETQDACILIIFMFSFRLSIANYEVLSSNITMLHSYPSNVKSLTFKFTNSDTSSFLSLKTGL